MVKNSRGVTLTELMVSVAIISVGILGFFGAFQFITKSLYVSRTRTLATNLAQERVEALKNLTYYELLITTNSSTDNNFTPGLVYDNGNYPPETISIGGITFTRYTYVALAQIDSDVISTVTYTFPDTGMKQVRVDVAWTDRGARKKYTLNNLLENPNVNPLDSSISGTITRAVGGGVMSGVVVKVEQNPDWNATTAADGTYTFRVYHGSYTIRASSASYYDQVSALSAANAGSNTTLNLSLTSIASGTITGIAWVNTGLVIGSVAAATNTYCQDLALHDVEYIELVNPTTFAIDIGQTNTYPKALTVNYYDESAGFDRADLLGGFNFVHVTTYVPAGKSYLIANCTSFVVYGAWINVDAYYGTGLATPGADIIRNDKAGSIQLVNAAGAVVDTVGWSDSNNSGPKKEGTSIPYTDIDGLRENQIVRVSSPGASSNDNWTYGRAYDSGNNQNDFLGPDTATGFTGIIYGPRSSNSSARTIISGKPAVGAYISASDPFSGSTQPYSATITSATQSLAYAPFRLTGVSTGTWSLIITSGAYFAQIDTITVTQSISTGVPNGGTVPAWTVPGHISTQLSSSSLGGFVEGQITDLNNAKLSGISVSCGGTTKTTGANGTYFAAVSSGAVTVIANPNNVNTAYIQTLAIPTVNTGEVVTQNFILSLGGALSGYVTSATTPIPNFVVTALVGGSQFGQAASDSSGHFTIRNLSTGTYQVTPVLLSGQDSSPNFIQGIVSSTTTIFVGTFTVTGALGNIVGTVTNAGELVTSGALILASTGTIASSPPAIAASSAAAQTSIYAVSSKADGSFVLPVRGNFTYRLSVYVPVIQASGSVTVTTKTYSGIAVLPSADTTQLVVLP